MKSLAIQDVAIERKRQIEGEGWTAEHDDKHDTGDLCLAGASYALNAGNELNPYSHGDGDLREKPPVFWPWEPQWWKPKDARRDLVRAAALIVAEIERVDRDWARAHAHVRFYWVGEESEVFAAESIDQLKNWPGSGPSWDDLNGGEPDRWGELDPNSKLTGRLDEAGAEVHERTLLQWLAACGDRPELPVQIWTQYA